jgi:hypothetical protein
MQRDAAEQWRRSGIEPPGRAGLFVMGLPRQIRVEGLGRGYHLLWT